MKREQSRYRHRQTTKSAESVYFNDQDVHDVSDESFIYNNQIRTVSPFYYASPSESCTDSVGFRNRDNSLSLERSEMVPLVYHGLHDYWHSDEYNLIHNRQDIVEYRDFNHALSPSDVSLSDVEFVTKAVANTNLSAPKVQTAALLAEMRDLPGLFKSVGANMSKYGANEYLKFQYGWRPLVSDLRKLITTLDKVDNQLKGLNRLNKVGVLRRRYEPPGATETIRDFKTIELTTDLIPAGGGALAISVSTEMLVRRWAVTEWTAVSPSNLLPSIGKSQLDKVRFAAFGANIDGPTMWQIMPWSWLIDWSTNMSEYISSQNNVVGAKCDNVILMKTTELISTAYPVPYYDFSDGTHSMTSSPGRKRTILKERILDIEPAAVQTGEYRSILGDSFKVSILGALAIQRFKSR